MNNLLSLFAMNTGTALNVIKGLRSPTDEDLKNGTIEQKSCDDIESLATSRVGQLKVALLSYASCLDVEGRHREVVEKMHEIVETHVEWMGKANIQPDHQDNFVLNI